ncbi:MAG: hypothetical protein ACI4D8_03770 [Wujia sp.]
MYKMSNNVDGYLFVSKTDYERALKEKNNIESLKKKINPEDMDEMRRLYLKLVSKNYFITPVGIGFLYELRTYLADSFSEGELPCIPVPKLGYTNKSKNTQISDERFSKLKKDYDKLSDIRTKLVIAVVALAVTIVGMFFIIVTNDNVGYFNAEEKVLNKYSAWEERLEAWEQELNDREAALDHALQD